MYFSGVPVALKFKNKYKVKLEMKNVIFTMPVVILLNLCHLTCKNE